MLFMPAEIASLMEAKLNETQEGLESPFIFRTDTMLGRYTRDYFVDESGQKKEFIYSVVTDPSGEIMATPGANITKQSIELHIYFKIKYRDRMYEAIDKFLSNVSGLFMDIPGTELASGENTKVTFTTSIPYFGEPMDQNIKTVSERSGLETNATMGFIEAVLSIQMATCVSNVMMGNEITYTLENGEQSEKLLLSDPATTSIKLTPNTEQYINESTSKSINSSNNLQTHLSFFVKGPISQKIMNQILGNIVQNEMYTLKIKMNQEEIATHQIILVDPNITLSIGGFAIISAYFMIADNYLI